jgi:hypothetical protein
VHSVLLLQTSARRNGIPIESLVFEHGIVNLEEREIGGPPKEGVYVKGLFLEGGCDMHRAPAPCSSRRSNHSIQPMSVTAKQAPNLPACDLCFRRPVQACSVATLHPA